MSFARMAASGQSGLAQVALAFLRSPIEETGYMARARQKRTDRALSAALGGIDDLVKQPAVTRAEADAAVSSAIDQVRALKRRVSGALREEEENVSSTRRQLEQMVTGSAAMAHASSFEMCRGDIGDDFGSGMQ